MAKDDFYVGLPKFDINKEIPNIEFNKNIKKVQEEFIKKGFYINNHGKFDVYLYGVICDYQRENKLKVTGEIDKETWNSLFNIKENNIKLDKKEENNELTE